MTRRTVITAAAVASVGMVALTAWWRPAPRLIWNASASVPVGFYAVLSPGRLTVGELVVARPPEPLAVVLAAGHYLPHGVPLIKHVGAVPGQTVCRRGATVSVDGAVRAEARDRDGTGRFLPVWSGCHSVARGEVFLLNASEPASLDGRYFGVLPLVTVIGRAVPIWVEKGR